MDPLRPVADNVRVAPKWTAPEALILLPEKGTYGASYGMYTCRKKYRIDAFYDLCNGHLYERTFALAATANSFILVLVICVIQVIDSVISQTF